MEIIEPWNGYSSSATRILYLSHLNLDLHIMPDVTVILLHYTSL